jgi:hypothetical protein
MDPDAELTTLRELAKRLYDAMMTGEHRADEDDILDFAHGFIQLDEHLSGGGARPVAWTPGRPLS